MNTLPRKLFLQSRHESAKRSTKLALEFLRQRIDQALDALEKEQSLDAHLIVNAGLITHDIALYNITMEIKAFEE